MASLASRNRVATALNQLAIFKCELPHLSRKPDAEVDRIAMQLPSPPQFSTENDPEGVAFEYEVLE
jgi:hypothetical protein